MVGGLFPHASPADGAAVLHGQDSPVENPTALIGGCIIGDGAGIDCRNDGLIKDAATVVDSRITRANPANRAAVLNIQCGFVVDAAAVNTGRVVPDGAERWPE